MKVSVLIPCYNERETIAEVIRRTLEVSFPCDRELIVVDDGSTDGSSEIIREFNEARLIQHEANRGKGAAIQTGVEASTGDILVIQDADMEYAPSSLPDLIGPILEDEADVVIGSRFIGQIEGMSWSHALANRTLSRLASLLSGQTITDIMTGHKAFKTSLLKEMLPRSREFEIEVELMMSAAMRKARILEIPISYCYRKVGVAKIGWRHGISSLILLLKLGLL